MRRFNDRAAAGRRLASHLDFLRGHDVVVLGLPRGGVPVAYEVAKALKAPLDVLLVRKLGVPFHSEVAFGAIGAGGARVISDDVVREARLSEKEIAAVEDRERAELQRRSKRYRGDDPPTALNGRIALIVDDGIATGATAQVACQVDLFPCCRSTVVRVEGRVIIRRSHAPHVFVVGAPANRCSAAIG
ncbi:hypothetical protein H7J74_23195 [Mycobacterium angelicum]|nr:phosphoribosyltransferase family protein [Mycobacterium angelicum]MCV7199346.1 hypothetical protein [Mycobacterium angelicum]